MDRELVSQIITSAVRVAQNDPQLEGHKNPRVGP